MGRSASISSSDDVRLLEFRKSFQVSGVATSVAVVITALALSPLYGFVFVGFVSITLIDALVGLVVTPLIGDRRWAMWHASMLAVATVGAATFSGGLASPVLLFVPTTGIFLVTMFPNERRWIALAPAITLCIGAFDVVAGTATTSELPMAIAGLLACVVIPVFSLDVVRVELSYRRRAVVDPLTGCLNRNSLDGRSNEIEQQHRLTGYPVAVVTFDVDHFKTVNDDHGHAAGDGVLQELAYVARKQLRRFELFYRLGGEEFALLLPGSTLQEAIELAERLRRAIERTDFGVGPVSISCGVAAAERNVDVSRLLSEADAALYAAKRSGRNRVRTLEAAA